LHIYHYNQNLSSDHLLSGVNAEYYTTNLRSSGRIEKGNTAKFKVSEFRGFEVSKTKPKRPTTEATELHRGKPQRAKFDTPLCGFPFVMPLVVLLGGFSL
jgi:hypothetical protein